MFRQAKQDEFQDYSYNIFEFRFNFQNKYVTTATAGSICSDLLNTFVAPKSEIELTTKYITQLQINNRIRVKYHGEAGGDNSLWRHFLWGVGLWSGYPGGLNINADYGIIGINIDMENFQSKFQLREV